MMHNFLQEIEEDLERQKLEELWRRYGPYIVFFVLLVVVATAGFTGWHTYRSNREQKASAALIDILSQPGIKPAAQIAALQDFAKNNSGETQAVLARFYAASLAVKSGDAKNAAAMYDAIAADRGVDSAFRQLADLLSVQTQMDSGNPALLEKRLQPLLAGNAPWRASAIEDTAFLALRAGDKAKARALFRQLLQGVGAPPDMAARAQDMLRYLGE
ncbi:MAG TPA: tetratricopeptide repeat protein [Alphaproteobacteria bacterium]|nr:tetratricopeptide repeat protein [Alphaproteobacteria bacterium]